MKHLFTLLAILLMQVGYSQENIVYGITTNNESCYLSYEVDYEYSYKWVYGTVINYGVDQNQFDIVNDILLFDLNTFQIRSDVGFGMICSDDTYMTNVIGIGLNHPYFVIEPRLLYDREFDYDLMIGGCYKFILFEVTTNFDTVEYYIGITFNI